MYIQIDIVVLFEFYKFVIWKVKKQYHKLNLKVTL